MLTCAAAGYSGVNLHGGGDGLYTPIAVGEHLSTALRPLYFGMQLAERFAGWELRECTVTTAANLTAWFAHRGREQQMVLINKGEPRVQVQLKGAIASHPVHQATRLAGPGLDAQRGITLTDVKPPSGKTIALGGYTALLLRWA